MRSPVVMALLALVPLVSTASGAEVRDQRFDVQYQRDQRTRFVAGTEVPIIPANACFSWHILIADPPDTVNFLERFILPEPWEPWRETPPTETSVVLEDGRIAETKVSTQTTAGWIDSGWCIDEGDKPGKYRIEVEIEGIERPVIFDFTYVEPEDFDFRDTYLPGERARTVNNSW